MEQLAERITSRTTVESNTDEDSESPNCALCQDSLLKGSGNHLLRKYSCGHTFHQQCIAVEMEKCPICRADILSEMICEKCGKLIKTNILVSRNGKVLIHRKCSTCVIDNLLEKNEDLKSNLLDLYKHCVNIGRIHRNIMSENSQGYLDDDEALKSIFEHIKAFSSVIDRDIASLI